MARIGSGVNSVDSLTEHLDALRDDALAGGADAAAAFTAEMGSLESALSDLIGRSEAGAAITEQLTSLFADLADAGAAEGLADEIARLQGELKALLQRPAEAEAPQIAAIREQIALLQAELEGLTAGPSVAERIGGEIEALQEQLSMLGIDDEAAAIIAGVLRQVEDRYLGLYSSLVDGGDALRDQLTEQLSGVRDDLAVVLVDQAALVREQEGLLAEAAAFDERVRGRTLSSLGEAAQQRLEDEKARLAESIAANAARQMELESIIGATEAALRDSSQLTIAELLRVDEVSLTTGGALIAMADQGEIAFAQLALSASTAADAIQASSARAQTAFAGFVPPESGAPVGLQAGGIVTRPTLALLGEAGPEAVIPLTRGGRGSVSAITININPQGNVIAQDDLLEQVERAAERAIARVAR